MNNIFIKSILYILFVFSFLTLFIFFANTNYSIQNLENSFKLVVYEYRPIVFFLSQFLFILFYKNITRKDIIICTIINWSLFLILKKLYVNPDYIFTIPLSKSELFIDRGNLNLSKFSLLNFNFIKSLLFDMDKWDIKEHLFISSFNILLFNISSLDFLDRKFPRNKLIKILFVIVFFLFLVYIWNIHFNLLFFIISILMLINRSKKV